MTGRLSRLRRSAPAVLLGLAFGVWLVTMVLGFTRPSGTDRLSIFEFFWGTALALPFPIVGFVIARREPSNPLGWLFLIAPILAVGGIAPWEYVNRREGDVTALVGFVGDAMFFIGISLMTAFFLVLFPTGRVPSRRWRWVVHIAIGGLTLLVIWSLGRECITWTALDVPDGLPSPSCADPMPPGFVRFENPFGSASLGMSGVFDAAGALGSGLVVLAFFLGVVSLVARYRAAPSVERAQLRWPLALFAVLAPMFLVLVAIDVVDRDAQFLASALFFAATIGLPVSIGFAITRYRLYEIDRIISRTVSYAIVALALATGFVALVLLPTVALGTPGPGDAGRTTPSWLVAGATLVLFSLFSPLLRRVQRFVDQRFDRARYDAQVVAQQFADRARDTAKLETIAADLVAVANEIVRPTSLAIWVKDSP